MTLQEILGLISDEEARVELGIDVEGEKAYLYDSFWLSDYRELDDVVKCYRGWTVEGISFEHIMDKQAQIVIIIKQHDND